MQSFQLTNKCVSAGKILSLAACVFSTAITTSFGAIIYRDFGEGIVNTTANPVSIDLATGLVVDTSNSTTLSIAASNGGGNLQFQIISGGGGPVISSDSLHAVKYQEGSIIGSSIQEDTSGFPGFSTNGGGRYRFFGGGDFASGEIGYVGYRFGVGNSEFNYGWAEIVGVDGVSITLLRAAYDNSGAEISVGAIPEPSTFALIAGFGALCLVAGRRFRAAQSRPV